MINERKLDELEYEATIGKGIHSLEFDDDVLALIAEVRRLRLVEKAMIMMNTGLTEIIATSLMREPTENVARLENVLREIREVRAEMVEKSPVYDWLGVAAASVSNARYALNAVAWLEEALRGGSALRPAWKARRLGERLQGSHRDGGER